MADKKSHSMTKDRGVAIHDKHPCDPPGDPDGDRDPDLGGGDDLDGEEEEDEDESASAMAADVAADRYFKAFPVDFLFKFNSQAFLFETKTNVVEAIRGSKHATRQRFI